MMEALDGTTPWYEFLSYCECCRSLGVELSVGRFTRYQSYLDTTKSRKPNLNLAVHYVAH